MKNLEITFQTGVASKFVIVRLLQLYRAPHFINSSGNFQSDAWFVFSGRTLIELGFGKIPKHMGAAIDLDGVVFPGLVNSYSRIDEAGLLPEKTPEKYWQLQQSAAADSAPQARTLLESALSKGTFFFNNCSRSIQFSRSLAGLDSFQGCRFYDPLSLTAESNEDQGLLPALHSLRCTTAEGLDEFLKVRRSNTHLVFLGSGEPAYEHDINMGQLGYLQRKGFYKARRVLLVEPGGLSSKRLADFGKDVPLPGVVLTPRMAKLLGYQRNDLEALINSSVYSLLGTGSAGLTDDADIWAEISLLREQDLLEDSDIWKMATGNAYDVMEVGREKLDFFWMPGVNGDLESMLQAKKSMRISSKLSKLHRPRKAG